MGVSMINFYENYERLLKFETVMNVFTVNTDNIRYKVM